MNASIQFNLKFCFIFRDATQELIKRGAKTDVYCDYVKSEFRAFLGQLPKKKGQHYASEKQYLRSYKNEHPMSTSVVFFTMSVIFSVKMISSHETLKYRKRLRVLKNHVKLSETSNEVEYHLNLIFTHCSVAPSLGPD